MSLMDILQGISNGPGGANPTDYQSGGMSPLTMGLLALLAYRAFNSGAAPGNIVGQGTPHFRPAGFVATDGGGLVDWLRGRLGGALSAGAAGNIVSSGLTRTLPLRRTNV
jgi:hypothetical protein